MSKRSNSVANPRRPALLVEYTNPNALKPYKGNARVHSPRQLEKLAASMSTHGFLVPALINGKGEIIAGHARVEAAKKLGWDLIPCIDVSHLTEAQQKAYRIADNRIAELATWNNDLLAEELRALSELDLDFSIELTGFDTPRSTSLSMAANKGMPPTPQIPSLHLRRTNQASRSWAISGGSENTDSSVAMPGTPPSSNGSWRKKRPNSSSPILPTMCR